MKLVILLCKSRYRKRNLNSFCKINFFGKYLIISFSFIFFYFGLILSRLKIFKSISIDSIPLIDKKNGFNFWLTGTIHKIPEKFRNFDNNYVNMRNVFHSDDNVFQLYPIIKKKIRFNKNKKIIYISSFKLKKPEVTSEYWKKYKQQINENLTLIDNKNFWLNEFDSKYNEQEKFIIYRDLKINLRMLIVNNILSNFKSKFQLYGTDWKNYFVEAGANIEKKRSIQNLYSGNICVDFGSISGSLTLYPRSIEIIESGGYLLQLKQSDSSQIFGKYENYFTFESLDDLNKKLKNLLEDFELYKSQLRSLNDIFQNSKQKIEKQLDFIL